MPQVLREYGKPGKNGDDFNWCNPGEIVGVFGIVCCGSMQCGCGRSFQGIDSLKSTTRAIVTEVSELEFAAICERTREHGTAAWNSQEIGDSWVRSLQDLAEELKNHPISSVLRVLKTEDSYQLGYWHPAHIRA